MPTPSGLELTLRLLTKTPNLAAIEVLDAGLRSVEPAVRAASARALALRRGPAAARALILAFCETPSDVQQAAITPVVVRRLRPAAAEALKGDDDELCRRACAYAEASGDHHLLAPAVEAARRPDHPHAGALARTALSLAKQLSAALDAPPPEQDARKEDPAFARRAALLALTRAADYFGEHGQRQLVEALLVLAFPDDPLVRRVLEDETHKAYPVFSKLLSTSSDRNVMRIVSHALPHEHPSPTLVKIMTSRRDRAFVEHLLDELGEKPALRAREAARNLPGFAWADMEAEQLWLHLGGKRQATAISFLAETSLSRRRLTDLCEMLLEKGEVAARVAVCNVLGKVQAKAASEVVRRALHDEHPSVVAAAAAQLRMRGMEGSTETLIRLLDHDSTEVKQAAQTELTELTYTAFKDVYQKLDADQRRHHGRLVGKADPRCTRLARQELKSPTPAQKLRAVEMIEDLGVVDELLDELIALLEHEDPALRAAAASALGESIKDESVAALTRILEDVSATVREIARAGLAGKPTPTAKAADSARKENRRD